VQDILYLLSQERAQMQIFKNDEPGYLRWLRDHPHGFVLNLWWNESPANPIVLHKADCFAIRPPFSDNFTGPNNYKVCDDDQNILIAWAQSRRGTFGRCGLCKP
jgi:hypothetical protein